MLKLYSFPVDSFIYGQPLYVPNMQIAGGTHNEVFVATENDSIYDLDADHKTSTPLWHTFIDTPYRVLQISLRRVQTVIWSY